MDSLSHDADESQTDHRAWYREATFDSEALLNEVCNSDMAQFSAEEEKRYLDSEEESDGSLMCLSDVNALSLF